MSEQTLSIINTIITILLPVLATGLTSVISLAVLKLKSKIDTDLKKTIVEDVVKFVQQVYSDLDGEEKLNKALETAAATLQEKGLKIGEVELRTLIEAAVYGVKQGLSSDTIGHQLDSATESLPAPEEKVNE